LILKEYLYLHFIFQKFILARNIGKYQVGILIVMQKNLIGVYMAFKKIFLFLLLFSVFSCFLASCDQKKQIETKSEKQNITSEDNTNVSNLKNIIDLNNQYTNNKNPETLLSIGKLALKMKISIDDFNKNNDYKNICHLRIVKSANYGDFVSYDGYHFNKIINDYRESDLVDDAEYYLIYIIPDEYNYEDLSEEKDKLKSFIKKYPNSNLKDTATKRYKLINEYLKKGNQPIID
jgi:hypothetical protein